VLLVKTMRIVLTRRYGEEYVRWNILNISPARLIFIFRITTKS